MTSNIGDLQEELTSSFRKFQYLNTRWILQLRIALRLLRNLAGCRSATLGRAGRLGFLTMEVKFLFS